jgi:hypothetical protein
MEINQLIEKSLEKSFSYQEYRTFVTHLLQEGKSTGNTQSEALTHYSSLNEVRMNRLDKTIKILPEIATKLSILKKKYIGLVLTEGWCGDAAQIVPILEKIDQSSNQIEFRYILRDENDSLMDQFLTNGSKSIPKVIMIAQSNLAVIGSWGPRPEAAAKLILDYKATFGIIDETAKTNLQKWYLQDKGISTQTEILALLLKAENA